MTPPYLRQAVPLVPVADINAAVRFFTDVLGFSVRVQRDDYASIFRDGATLRLVLAALWTDMPDAKRQISCYIDMTGLDAFFEAHKSSLMALPNTHMRAPFDQPYGQRELHVTYGSLIIRFGEPIAVKGAA